MATIAVTGRADLADGQWAVLESLLPRARKPGRPPEHAKRQLIDGIRWRTRLAAPWRDVPPGYGPWQTVYGPSPAAAERDLAEMPCRAGLMRPGDHLGRVGGFHGGAGAPARGQRPKEGRSAGRAAQRGPGRACATTAWPVPHPPRPGAPPPPPRQPRLPAQARDPVHHPGESRPEDPPPQEQSGPRRPPAIIDLEELQGPPRGGARHRPAKRNRAVATL